LQVKWHKSSIKFGKGDKLSPRFVGPFEIVERKGLVAYRLALPDSLRRVEQVKVQWDSYSPHSATWEDAYDMRQQFPFLFDR
jgi:hypothetical protein